MTLIYILLIVLAAAQIADWYTTKIVIATGKAHEGNFLPSLLLNKFGIDLGLAIKGIIVMIGGGISGFVFLNPIPIGVLIAPFLYAIFSNLRLYKKFS